MQAIHVKTLAPTEKLQTRYKAIGLNRCVTTVYEHNLSHEANAALAAQQLLDDHNLATNDRLSIKATSTLPDNSVAVLIA